MKNTWDYKVGDLIEVQRRDWDTEIGVIISFRDKTLNNRKYWEWRTPKGTIGFFVEDENRGIRIKVLAAAECLR